MNIDMSILALVLSTFSVGALLGILFELVNYRRSASNSLRSLDKLKSQFNSDCAKYEGLFNSYSARLENIEMLVKSKR